MLPNCYISYVTSKGFFFYNLYNLNYAPKTSGVQSGREITSAGTGTKTLSTYAVDNLLTEGGASPPPPLQRRILVLISVRG
jgi:hypothetical protein